MMARDATRLSIELRRARVPLAWFAFLLLAGGITLYLIVANLNFERPFENRYKVDVAFDSVKGAFEGTHPVRIAGVTVGVISDVRVEGEGAVATLSLEDEYAPIYRDAELRIRPQTPLEDIYVSIDDRGTPEAGELEEGDPPLPAEQTQAQVQVSRVLQTFEPQVRKSLIVLLDQMQEGLDGRGRDLEAAFVQLAPFLHEARRVSEIVADRRENVRRIVTNFGEIADELAVRDEQLNRLVTQGASTMQSLASVEGSLSQTIAELPPTMAAVRSSFASLRAAEEELDPALQSLLPAAQQLEDGLAGLEDFSNAAVPALEDLRPSVSALRPMAAELRPTADSLRDSMRLLRPQAPRVNEMTVTTVECLDAITHFFQDTLSVGKFGNPFGPFPRGSQGGNGSSLAAPVPVTRLTKCYEDGG